MIIPGSLKTILSNSFDVIIDELVLNNGIITLESLAFGKGITKTLRLPKSIKSVDGTIAYVYENLYKDSEYVLSILITSIVFEEAFESHHPTNIYIEKTIYDAYISENGSHPYFTASGSASNGYYKVTTA